MYSLSFISSCAFVLKIIILMLLLLALNVNGVVDLGPETHDQHNIKLVANDFFVGGILILRKLFYYECINLSNLLSPYDIKVSKMQKIPSKWKIYTAAIGKKQNNTQLYFTFGGIVQSVNIKSFPEQNNSSMFIGKFSFNCETNSIMRNISFVPLSNHLSNSYVHEDYYVIGVEPYGQIALGFSNTFILIYDLKFLKLKSWSANLTWPNSTFLPLAVDLTSCFAVVAGFTQGIKTFTPTIYFIRYTVSKTFLNLNFLNSSSYNQIYPNNLVVVDKWSSEHSLKSPLMKMSVSIDQQDYRILVGIPADNTVHLFLANRSAKEMSFTYTSSRRNNPGIAEIGYGSSIAWLNGGKKVAILANVYDRSILLKSQIHFYDISMTKMINETILLSVFPNKQQPIIIRPLMSYSQSPLTYFGPLIVTLTSNSLENGPSSLTAIDKDDKILLIFPSKPGLCSTKYHVVSQTQGNGPVRTVLSFLLPDTSQCPPGMYKNESGSWACSLCETGTMNPGVHNTTSINCIPCSNDSFCPLGSIGESKLLEDINQKQTYPESPETVVYDDILMQMTFSTDCLSQSPLFWSLIVSAFILIILVIMGLMKFSSRFKNIRLILKKLLRHGDLLGEGELWIGGLFSIVIIVLLSFVYKFSYSFHHQYPIEKVNGSTFSCKSTVRNSKFQTSLQSLRMKPSEQTSIFNLLNSQKFTIHVDFVSTVFTCDDLTIESSVIAILPRICHTKSNTIHVSMKLPSQISNIKFVFRGINTIGAVRVGLTGSIAYDGESISQPLNFSKFFFAKHKILSQNPKVQMQLTKIINITKSLKTNEKTKYSGIWIATFAYDKKQMFLSQQEYQAQEIIFQTILSVKISETPFFIKNIQQPIAKQTEIVFHTILFTGVCLDLVGKIILLCKLLIIPIVKFLIKNFFHQKNRISQLVFDDEDEIRTDKMIRQEITDLKRQLTELSKLIHQPSVSSTAFHSTSYINSVPHRH